MDLSRAARWVALAATALVVVATLAHGWSIAVDDPSRSPRASMSAIEIGDEYAAWTGVFAPRDHVSVLYVANGTPDRILLLRMGDVDALLRGDAVQPLAEFDPPAVQGGAGQPAPAPKTMGRFDFAAPSPECPPPTGGCLDETMPVLVWLKGDAWRGASVAQSRHYVVLNDAWEGPVVDSEPRDGPVRPDLSRTQGRIVAMAPAWLGLASVAGALALVAALAHAALELRRRDDAPLVPGVAPTESTETMLMLARLTTLYVDAIRRSFLVSLATILGVTAAVLFFGLPPMLERVSEQFRHMWELQELHVALFTLAPLLVMTVSLALWSVAYARVRRELRRWRDRTRTFDDEAARILGA